MIRLNESPSEKEGKSKRKLTILTGANASMKALPKRKGNGFSFMVSEQCAKPQ